MAVRARGPGLPAARHGRLVAGRQSGTLQGYRHDPRSSLSPMISKSMRRKV